MSIIINHTELDTIYFNGTELDKVYYNNNLVFEKQAETWTGIIRIDVSDAKPTYKHTKWTEVSSSSLVQYSQTNITKTKFNADVNPPVQLAAFKVDISKFKYMDISRSTDWKINFFSSLDVAVGSDKITDTSLDKAYISTTANAQNLDLTSFNGLWCAPYIASNASSYETETVNGELRSVLYGTITLHN